MTEYNHILIHASKESFSAGLGHIEQYIVVLVVLLIIFFVIFFKSMRSKLQKSKKQVLPYTKVCGL